MKSEKALPPLWAMLAGGARTCLKLWPLFLVRFLFAILQYIVLFFCLLILFGPALVKLGKDFFYSLNHPESVDQYQSDMPQIFLNYFSDPTWVVILVAMVFLFSAWWLMLSTILNGGVFGSFWRHLTVGKLFSLRVFFKDGLRFFWPVVTVQAVLFLCLFLAGIVLGFVLGVGFALGSNFGFDSFVFIFLAVIFSVVLALLSVIFAAFLWAYWLAAMAGVTKGVKVGTALRVAFDEVKRYKFRVTLGIVLVFAIYLAASIVIWMVFLPLALIPLIGAFFSLIQSLIGAALGLFLGVYLPALAVAFYAERKTAT